MTPEDRQFLKEAYQALADKPLEPGNPYYVPLHGLSPGDDVVEALKRTIEFSADRSRQYFCAHSGSGLSTELWRLEEQLIAEGYEVVYWGPNDTPDFIDHLLAGYHSQRSNIVLVIDNIQGYEDELSHGIHCHHIIYNAQASYEPSSLSKTDAPLGYSVRFLPTPSVRHPNGNPDTHVLNLFKTLLSKRFDWMRLFGQPAPIEKLILMSGGNLRELFGFLREIIVHTESLPVDSALIDKVLEQRRQQLLPLEEASLKPLAQIATTHELIAFPSADKLLDSGLIILYRNDRIWFDIHPLIRDYVLEKAGEQLTSPPQPALAPTPPNSPSPERAILDPSMRLSLIAHNYRALRHVHWTIPRGVSALVGPNGSGKTTLLGLPELLSHALGYDLRIAVDHRGGPGDLKNALAEHDAPLILGAQLDNIRWQLELSPKGASQTGLLQSERAEDLQGNLIFDRNKTLPGLSILPGDTRLLLSRFAELRDGAALRPLHSLLKGYRAYIGYDLADIRQNGSQNSSDDYLHTNGRNIFSVLRVWRDRAATLPRWEFIRDSLRLAFPDTFYDLDFEVAGQTISGRIRSPIPDIHCSTYYAAQGLLVALLHLTAVASAEPAGIVAIDEVENGLHPYAIRRLIEAMRNWADTHGISIILATHSPVVLDQFKDSPAKLFVMEPGRETTPTRLDELHNPEWLAHFSLGDLYAHEEFGAQQPRETTSE